MTGVRRILVIGPGGAGKTTLARQLGRCMDLPVIHLDAHFWQPGWVATDPDAWARRVADLVARAAWVMDGNYGGTMDQRLAAADAVIFLDMPPRVCLWRVVRRRFRYRRRVRPGMGAGCPERLTGAFVRWIWRYRRDRRPGILDRLAALGAGQQAIILETPAAVDRFLAALYTEKAQADVRG